MSAGEYDESESRSFMTGFLEKSGINTFHHFKTLATSADRWVVSPNVDTIYSVATVNTSQGFVLSLPDVGRRFIATQIVTEDGVTPYYFYGGGKRSFKSSDFATKFVAVGVRIGTDGTPEDVEGIVNQLQPQYKITGAATETDLPPVETATLLKVRAALLPAYSKMSNTFGIMVKHVADITNWERFTYAMAGAWGLAADKNAMYAIGGPADARANTCYIATFPKVDVKAFYSITVYGPQKYLMTDEDNVISSNRKVVTNDDGSFDVAFGGEPCRKLAPNYIATPQDDWSFLLRAYRPNVEAFKSYRMPDVKQAN
nr:DUF1254 domain-containing protein [Marinicella sp. W31]MDC2879475.1 DUF1254 domain-containing protein [Marinicella sp. W31]